jgi:hypothetical protein
VNNVSPTVALDVTGAGKFSTTVTAQTGFKLPANGNGTSPTLAYNNSLGFGVSGTGIFFGNLYNSDLSTAMQLRVTNSAGTDITALTITPTGNVGIGITAPSQQLSVEDTILIKDSGSSASQLIFGDAANDFAGRIFYNHGSDAMQFFVNADERMRITSGGNVCIGTTNAQDARLTLTYAGGVDWAVGPKSGTSSFAIIGSTGGGGGVYVSNGGTSWAAWSDRRVKKNIENLNYGLSEILSISPVRFNYLTDDNDNADRIGFIAQDVQEYIPEMVNVAYDDILGMSSTDLVPVLVKAIQEQQTQINELKALLNA